MGHFAVHDTTFHAKRKTHSYIFTSIVQISLLISFIIRKKNDKGKHPARKHEKKKKGSKSKQKITPKSARCTMGPLRGENTKLT